MKPSLVLRMGQQLTMTPQLQQAIRLLQLSTLDLQQEIQEALESNPMLERQEEGDDFDNADPLADNIEQKPNSDVQEPSYQEPPLRWITWRKANGMNVFPTNFLWIPPGRTSTRPAPAACPAMMTTSGISPPAPQPARACRATCCGN